MNKLPTLVLLLIAYNIIVLTLPNLDLATPLLTVPLISGALFSFTVSDLLIALGIVALTIEIFKATRSSHQQLSSITSCRCWCSWSFWCNLSLSTSQARRRS